MKQLVLWFLFWMIAMAGFSQSLPYPNQGAILQRTNLDVRWKGVRHPWPKTLWTYQMIPTKFPLTLVSNLMSLGNLTEKDRWGAINTNGMTYFNYKSSLRIAFATSEIEYSGERPRYSETNLATDVPGTNQLFPLATNFLPKLGINLTEIPKTKRGRLEINCYEPAFTEYFTHQTFITNIEYRTASFGRLIDGAECDPDVGSCKINFGEHGRIEAVWLYWRSVERDKLYSAATPDEIIRWIRQGKAVLPRMYYADFGNEIPIDWSTVKRVTRSGPHSLDQKTQKLS